MTNSREPDPFTRAIMVALRSEFDRIATEESEAAVKRTRERIAGSLDGLALKVLRQYEIERQRDHVVIRVDKRALDQ